MLWSLRDLFSDLEQIRSLECLEAEVLVVEVSVVDDGRVKLVCVSHDAFVGFFRDHGRVFACLGVDVVVEVLDDGGELLLRLLVEVGHSNTSSEDGIVGMGDCHVCCSLGRLGKVSEAINGGGESYQVVELDRGNTLVDTRDDFLCDSCGVDMFRIESVTQPRDAGCDLVELNAFFASIWRRRVS